MDVWFAALWAEQEELARHLRSLIMDRLPRVEEVFRSERPCYVRLGPVCYLAAHRAHVHIGFFRGNELGDVDAILEGTGRTTRDARFARLEDLEGVTEEVRCLLDEALRLNRERPKAPRRC